jgi:hypothetical protein
MREKKQKNRMAEADAPIQTWRVQNWRVHAWPDDIVAEVFELWIGISRLMARMREPDQRFGPDRALRPLTAKKTSANRRPQPRNAA